MSRIFLFDVDGTITPSRSKIEKPMLDFLVKRRRAPVNITRTFLVTGSDFPKTVEQIGKDNLPRICHGIFACSGNQFFTPDGQVIFSNEWQAPSDLKIALNDILDSSYFPYENRAGVHIEERPGSVNFSVVGRNANKEQREIYKEFDNKTSERKEIVKILVPLFPNIDFTIGGETGIDICPKGCNKAQVFKYLSPFLFSEPLENRPWIYFFGDKICEDGNDFPLAKILEERYEEKSFSVNVNSPTDVLNWMKEYLLYKDEK